MGVQYREEDINSLDTLRNIPVTGEHSEGTVPLRNVAQISTSTGPAVINHRNITRATDIFVNVEPGYDTGSVVRAIEERLAACEELGTSARGTGSARVFEINGEAFAGKGYLLEMQGEVRTMLESFEQFSSGLLIAALLVYLVLVAQFKSFVDPIPIMLTVPLSFIGVFVLLALTGTNLSIMTFMGLIMTVGIVVEYSIVLIHFANQRLADGASPTEAVLEAAHVRLRPILMTSLTTALALLPMAFGLAGGEANGALARTIIGGVMGATLLTLLVVPCLFVMFKGNHAPGSKPA